MDPLQNVWNTLQQISQALTDLNSTVTQLNTTVSQSFPQSTGTTTSATAGSASPLPGDPAGYLTITLPDGQPAKIAYWNP